VDEGSRNGSYVNGDRLHGRRRLRDGDVLTIERVRERLTPVYTFFVNKWYFDELIDALFVRPGRLVGAVAQSVIERVFINSGVTGGATGVVRAGSAAVRGMQSGFLRYYAALLIAGLAGVGLYFLLASS
jgi:NADH-quinone oxidoreductase subunit L